MLLHPPEDAAAGVPAPIAMRGNLLLLLRAGEAFREFSCAEHSSAALAHSPPGEHLTLSAQMLFVVKHLPTTSLCPGKASGTSVLPSSLPASADL